MLRQHARDIERDVSVTDDRDLLGVQRPVAWHIGVAVVPRDHAGGTEGTFEVDAWDVEVGVVVGAGREDDRVIEIADVRKHQVAAIRHVADEADVAAVQNLVQGVDDALDAWVVRRHSVADQPERCRMLVEQVDADLKVAFRFGEDIRGIDAGRAGTDNRHSQWTLAEVLLQRHSFRLCPSRRAATLVSGALHASGP